MILAGVVIFLLLDRTNRQRAILYTIGAAVLTILLDFAPLSYRLPAPTQISSGLPLIAAIVVLLVIGITLWTNRTNIVDFWNNSIRNRLTIILLSTAILPVLLISGILGITTYTQVRSELLNTTFDRLDTINEIKYAQLSSYMKEINIDVNALSDTMGSLVNNTLNTMEALNTLRRNQINQLFQTWNADVRDVASDPGVVSGLQNLILGFESQNVAYTRQIYRGRPDLERYADESVYSAAHADQHRFFTGYIDIHSYEDAFLIAPDGSVVYSVNKTEVFATNLATGEYRDTSLGKLYANLLSATPGTAYIADASTFGDTYTMFIGAPVYDGTRFVGILAYQLPMDAISEIMAERTGQGLTGESFLIAMDEEEHISYRSDRTSLGNTIFVRGYDITDIASPTMRKALAGTAGGGLVAASTGETRINAYTPLNIEGLNWAIFTSVNATEALSPVHITGEKDYLSLYRENYGYYDIFLIHPNGTIFFTVAQEADYNTNILTGEFSNTNLSTLVQEVLANKTTEFADFNFYEPSGDIPAAFVATPVLNADNDVTMVIAVQVPIEGINAIMNESHGVGESGETYIIGQDFLGRMDSRFIDAFGVNTTVLNPDFAVDTIAVRSAIDGKSGQDIIPDFRGVNVLSVWKPYLIGEADEEHPQGQIWAVITEIEETEAFAPINQLANTLGLLVGLAALIIGAIAVFFGARFALNFVEPILTLTNTATRVAEGDFSLRFELDSQDEIGTLTKTFNTMTAQLEETLGGLEERIASRTKDLETVANISTVTATIRSSEEMLTNMVQLTQRGFDLYHAHVFTFNPETDQLDIVACAYNDDEHEGTHGTTSIPIGQQQSLVAIAARTRQPIIVNDVLNEPGWLPNAELPDTRSELAVPMLVGDELLGVLDVQSEKLNAFSEEDANIQMTLASQIATALQNIITYERAQKRAELEALVNVIGQRIQRSNSIEETLQIAIRELGTAIGAKRVNASLSPTPLAKEESATERPLISENEQAKE